MKPTSNNQPISTNLAQNKIALQIFGPKISTRSARKAAIKIAEHITSPSVIEFVAQPYLDVPGATLCVPQMRVPIISTPTTLFAELKLSVSEIPDDWMPSYAEWMARLQRAHEFRIASLHLDCETRQIVSVKDSIVAGLLLYLCGGSVNPETRSEWLEVAIKTPAGSWLAAEGLHTREERQRILDGVRSDSRLLFAVSQIAGFGSEAATQAQSHLDVYGGLILASSGTPEQLERWLRTTALAGCARADAACASLVLQSCADARDRAVWIATLQNKKHARFAYEAIRWAKQTWTAANWNELKNGLREYAIADRGQWFSHWFTSVEPEHAMASLGDASLDPLWATELLNGLGPEANDYALRFRMGERLDDIAVLVLRWLNLRHERRMQ